jgi:hypothetical protein
MKRFSSIALLLLLLSVVAPVLACMTDGAMTREESVCCRSMHGNCGQMQKMGCCRTETQSDERPQVAAKAPSLTMDLAVICWVHSTVVSVGIAPLSSFDIPAEYSPPGLLTAKTIVLRI